MGERELTVPVWVEEPTGVEQRGQVLLGGVPLKQGTIYDGGWFALRRSNSSNGASFTDFTNETSFAVEGTPAAWWPDGSIVVRYEADHDVHADWVANSANIDASPIVWAREMGGGQEKELLDYFNDRTVWLLDADELPHRLVPYADAPPPSTAPAVRPRAREKTSIH